MRVPDVLRQVLDVTGLNQATLAKKISVSQGTISKWLSDQVSPNKTQWDAVLELIAGEPRLVHLLETAGGPSIARVPLISWVSAGDLADAESRVPLDDVPMLAVADLGRGNFFALRVEGDSMDRLSPPGSIIIVNRADRELMPARSYVFSVRGETTYKRWQPDPDRIEPYSTNPAHQAIFIKRHRDLAVVGRVWRTVLDL